MPEPDVPRVVFIQGEAYRLDHDEVVGKWRAVWEERDPFSLGPRRPKQFTQHLFQLSDDTWLLTNQAEGDARTAGMFVTPSRAAEWLVDHELQVPEHLLLPLPPSRKEQPPIQAVDGSGDPPAPAAHGGTDRSPQQEVETRTPGAQPPGARPSLKEPSEDAIKAEGETPPIAGNSSGGEESAGTPPASDEWCFVPSGNGYHVSGLGESGHLSGYKGLSDIAQLIATPGVPVLMVELEGAHPQLRKDRRSRQPAVDAEACQRIKDALWERRADKEKAEKENNTVEAAVAQKEIEELEASLTAATGLRGKVRDLNNLFDKLRPKIHGRLQTIYDAMRKADPPMVKLAEHFELSISSEGVTAFVYRPAGDPPPWQFRRAVEK